MNPQIRPWGHRIRTREPPRAAAGDHAALHATGREHGTTTASKISSAGETWYALRSLPSRTGIAKIISASSSKKNSYYLFHYNFLLIIKTTIFTTTFSMSFVEIVLD